MIMHAVIFDLFGTLVPNIPPQAFRRNLSAMAEHQVVSKPTMTNTINTLEERGWVRRVRSADDRRVVLVELTDAGREVLASAEREAESRLAELLSRLSDSEIDTLVAGLMILHRLFENNDIHTETDLPIGDM